MLLGCRFAHPHQAGANSIRPDESQDTRLAEPRQPKFVAQRDYETTHDGDMAQRAPDPVIT